MKTMIKAILEKVLVAVLDWSAGVVISYFDINKDGKVSKKEIKQKLGPNTQILLKKLR